MRDLEVHGDDLVIATHGRGFYIMDDVEPLRELAGEPLGASDRLFAPAAAIRVRPSGFTGTPKPKEEPMAANPPDGAYIDYWLASRPKGPVEIVIRDEQGRLVRQASSSETAPKLDLATLAIAPEWLMSPRAPSAEQGGHRYVWDLHYASQQQIGGGPRGGGGLWAPPGRYRVTLSVDGQDYSQALELRPDPRVKADAQAYGGAFELCRRIEALRVQVHSATDEADAKLKALSAAEPATDPSRRAALSAIGSQIGAILARPAAIGWPQAGPPASESEGLHGIASVLEKLAAAVDGADGGPTADDQAAYDVQAARLESARAALSALTTKTKTLLTPASHDGGGWARVGSAVNVRIQV